MEQEPGTDEPQDVDDPNLFDPVAQARYLLKLREGEGARTAARQLRFEPRMVMQYRKDNPVFEELCKEAEAEADEAVEAQLRAAAIRGEPHALRTYANKLGYGDAKKGPTVQVAVFNGAAAEGNPTERILKMQEAVLERPQGQLPPKIIDVSLDEA